MNRSAFIVLLTLFFIGVSCRQNKQNDTNDTIASEQGLDSLKLQNIRNLGTLLSPESRKLVSPWVYYQQLDELIDKYYTYSVQEVLFSAAELTTATERARDSIPIERLKEIDVRTRLDVLHNSALRLKDMASIPNIKIDEVNEETQQMIDAFGALNSKINNITSQERLEAELKDLESKIRKEN